MSSVRQIANKWDPKSPILESAPPVQVRASAGPQASAPAAAPRPPAPPVAPASVPTPQDPRSRPSASGGFAVRLVDARNVKIAAIKVLREITSLGLKECKDLVDQAPSIVVRYLSVEQAQQIAQRFTAVGAVADVRADV